MYGKLIKYKMAYYVNHSFEALEPLLKKLANIPEYPGKGNTSRTTEIVQERPSTVSTIFIFDFDIQVNETPLSLFFQPLCIYLYCVSTFVVINEFLYWNCSHVSEFRSHQPLSIPVNTCQ